MKRLTIANGLTASALIVLSGTAGAGELNLTWADPAKFTDIVASNGTDKSYRNSVEKALAAEFTAQADKLPVGQKMSIHVTNVDLAGEVDPIPSRAGYRVRVLKDVYYPQISLDYRITDAAGTVVKEQQGAVLKDAGFLASASNAASRQDFYYERHMIKEWFGKEILAKP